LYLSLSLPSELHGVIVSHSLLEFFFIHLSSLQNGEIGIPGAGGVGNGGGNGGVGQMYAKCCLADHSIESLLVYTAIMVGVTDPL
jgi:hypothetical protein